MKCRVYGCVALPVQPRGATDLFRLGTCVVHQRMPAEELKALLAIKAGGDPLRRVAVGVEYERADGTRYGYDHDGNYYAVPRKSVFG